MSLFDTGEVIDLGTGLRNLFLSGGTIRGGTVSGNANGLWDTGQLGSAIRLDGRDFLEIPHSDSVDLRRQITIETWINVDSFDTTWQQIVQKGDGSGGNTRTYSLWLNSSGYLLLTSADASGEQVIQTSNGSIQLGQWHHFAGVIDRDTGEEL